MTNSANPQEWAHFVLSNASQIQSQGAWNPELPTTEQEWGPSTGGVGEWDYQVANETDMLGPGGKQLPEGALAWDNYGRPYFGTGFKGWWAEVESRLDRPFEDSPSIIEGVKEAYKEVEESTDWDKIAEESERGFGVGFESVKWGGKTLAKMMSSVWDNFKNSHKESGDPTPIAYVARYFEEGARLVFTAFDRIGKAGKAAVGTAYFTAHDIADDSTLPSLNEMLGEAEAPGWVLDVLKIDQEKWVNVINNIDPLSFAWDVVRSIEAPTSLDEKKAIFGDAIIASRITMTGMLNEATRHEYVRRVKAGEDPGLLATELENPIAELAGELLLDPLNFVGILTKFGKSGLFIKQASKVLDVPDDMGDIIRVAQTADDLGALEKSQEVRKWVMESVDTIKNRHLADSRKVGLLGHTTTGTRTIAAMRMNPALTGLVVGARDADDAGDILQSLIKIASDNPDEALRLAEVTEGMAALKHVKSPRLFLSPAAQELGVALRNLTDGGKVPKWWDDFVKITDNAERIAFMEGKMDDALKGLYPTIQQRINAIDKAKEAGQVVEDTVPAYARYVNSAHQKAQKVLEVPHTIMHNVFIRFNPGVYMRNMQSDTATIFTDEGFFALFGKRGNLVNKVENILGYVPEGMTKAFGSVGKVLEKTATYEKIEQWSGARVFHAAVKRNYPRILGTYWDEAADILKVKGIPDDEIKLAKQVFMQTYGDVDKTMNTLGMGKKVGFLEQSRGLGMLDSKDLRMLDDLYLSEGCVDEMIEVANKVLDEGGPVEDVLKGWDELFEQVINKGDEFAKQPHLNLAEDVAEEAAAINRAADAGNVSENGEIVYTNLRAQNRHTSRLIRDATEEMMSNAEKAIPQIAVDVKTGQRAMGELQNIKEEFAPMFNDAFTGATQSRSDDLIGAANQWSYPSDIPNPTYAQTKAYRQKLLDSYGSTQVMWNRMGIPGTPPKDLSLKQLFNVYWDDFVRPSISNMWTGNLELYASEGKRFVKALTDFGANYGYEVASNKWHLANDAYIYSQKLRSAIVFKNGMEFARGPEAYEVWKIMNLAQKYNIPGATDSGTFTKRLLNTIEKYGMGEFERLEDVPFDTARKAFEARATEKGKDIIPVIFIDEAGAVTEDITALAAAEKLEAPTEAAAVQAKLDEVEFGALPGDKATSSLYSHSSEAIDPAGKIDNYVKQYVETKDPKILEDFIKDEPLAGRITDWVINNKEAKNVLVDYLKANPQEATEIQRYTEYVLSGKYGDQMTVYSGKMTMYRTLGTEADIVNPWDSMTQNPGFARAWQQGEGRGVLLEYEVPTENIFATHETHPALRASVGEEEIILNQRGIQDAKLISVDGKAPTPEQIEKYGGIPSVVEEAKPAGVAFERIYPPNIDNGAMPTPARVTQVQMDGYKALFERVKNKYAEAWGTTQKITVGPKDSAYADFWKVMRGRKNQAGAMVDKVATGIRDWALHDYRVKRRIDLAMAYLYPYWFWPSRTYSKWLGRIVMNPGIISSYGHYRDYMEKVNADAPDFWKYQIRVDNLLGFELENPLFFNLEASINPMYGMLQPNFNDPAKRTGLWTAALDDLGKGGFSTHPLMNIATALILMSKGEEEAAARWGGTGLIPQAKAIKAATSLAGIGPPGGVQWDPFIKFFSGGSDPYEKRQIGRAMYAITEENPALAAQAYEDVRLQEGELWDQAHTLAVNQRAPGQIASFLLGTGFKPRTEQDMMIDEYDKQRRMLFKLRDFYTVDEWRRAWSELRQEYPEGDLVILSRKGGIDRDIVFASNVMSRIPPGQSDDFAEAAGIPMKLMEKFWEGKWDLDNWGESDRNRFMAGIVDLGAILEIPDDATRQEWDEAKNRRGEINTKLKVVFGEDIFDKIDMWYGMLGETPEERMEADAYARQNPDVEATIQAQRYLMMQNPVIMAYYGGLDMIERYWKGVMYNKAEEKYGVDIWDTQRKYWDYRDAGQNADAKSWLKQHPELKKYWTFRKRYQKIIDQQIISAGSKLREGKPFSLRDEELKGFLQEDIAEKLMVLNREKALEQVAPEDWQAQIGGFAFEYIIKYLFENKPIPKMGESLLEREAAELGISADRLIQLVGMSVMRQQEQQMVLQ